MKSLQTIKKAVLKLNKCPQPFDPGILELVVGLRAFDIPTQFSCAGHKERNGTFPFVDIRGDEPVITDKDWANMTIKMRKSRVKKNIAIQKQLINLLTDFYKDRKVEYKYQISFTKMAGWEWVKLISIGSDLLKDMPAKTFRKELLIYQNEMKIFGAFLTEKYQKSVNK